MSALSLVYNSSLRNNISLQLLSSETDLKASMKAMNQIQKVMLFTKSSQMSMMVEQENHSLFLSLPPSHPSQPKMKHQCGSANLSKMIHFYNQQ